MNTFLLCVLFGLIFAFIIYRFFFNDEAVVKEKLNSLDLKAVCDVIEGDFVKLKGEIVLPKHHLIAPISKRKCSYFHIIVHHHKNSGSDEHDFTEEVINEKKSIDIIIKVGEQFVLIDQSYVKSFVIKDKTYQTGLFRDLNVDMAKYLEKQGLNINDLTSFNSTLAFEEGVLEEGETVLVAGKAIWKNTSELKHKFPVNKILLLVSDKKEPVYLTDDLSTVF